MRKLTFLALLLITIVPAGCGDPMPPPPSSGRPLGAHRVPTRQGKTAPTAPAPKATETAPP
jgi:hypothetical protein